MATIGSLLGQIKSIELQLEILKAQVRKLAAQEDGPRREIKSFADLHGIFPGQPQATEEDIDAVLYTFDWGDDEDE